MANFNSVELELNRLCINANVQIRLLQEQLKALEKRVEELEKQLKSQKDDK
ncbi:MAG: DUF5320 domain-containing protein [Clostridia bacterium]|nr:DUF5320 domain-containing protein [Clostridia bacterium]